VVFLQDGEGLEQFVAKESGAPPLMGWRLGVLRVRLVRPDLETALQRVVDEARAQRAEAPQ
jgi:hypothetical protein